MKDHSDTCARNSGGKILCACALCRDTRCDHKENAATQVRNNHPVASRSTTSVSGTQRSIFAHFRPVASKNAIRDAFNPGSYQVSLVSMLTRRTVPFSAIEWNKFKELALACSLHVRDSRIISRRKIVRYIPAKYDFESSEIKNSLSPRLVPSTSQRTSAYRYVDTIYLLCVHSRWTKTTGLVRHYHLY
jgi:hypothetical protein